MKVIYILLVFILVAAGFYFAVGLPDSFIKNSDKDQQLVTEVDINTGDQELDEGDAGSDLGVNNDQRSLGDDAGMEFPTMDDEKLVVADGAYVVNTESSIVRWSGKKPLISGYTNSGTIAVNDGTITVANNSAEGDFTIDMNTLDVGLTAKKPGKEGALEGHLKGEGWFDVATYPTATFIITSVTKQNDSDKTHIYNVIGDLTMKGVTNEITFPAEIYQTPAGDVRAVASTEIDRIKWGITAGSDSFFDNLADNVIDDMIAISFDIVAQ